MASALVTYFSSKSSPHLSSTSWKRQLGVCRVVKILLSGGIRGAEHRKVWPLGFIQNGSAPHPSPGLGSKLLAILPTTLPWAFQPTKMVWTILVLLTNTETENKALFLGFS